MKNALLTAVAFSALAVAQAHAQSAATPPAAAPSTAGEQQAGSGGCPCCQKMAMMQPKKDQGSGMQHEMPATPSTPPRQ